MRCLTDCTDILWTMGAASGTEAVCIEISHSIEATDG